MRCNALVSWAAILVALFTCLTPLSAAEPNPAAASPELRAGAAAVDVSPIHFPAIVSGGFLQVQAGQVNDPLFARCVVLESGDMRIALLVVDSLMIERDVLDPVKEQASQATGIPVDHIMISATHTHSAPALMGALGTPVDEPYRQWVLPHLVRAIVLAAKNVEPAEIGWNVTPAPDYTHNRRWILRPDRVQRDPFGTQNVRAMMHPGHESANHVGPSGPVDPDLTVVSIRARDGRPIALLANYSQHYFGSPAVSSDYFGRFSDKLEQRINTASGKTTSATPAFVAMISAGTSGDLMWMDYSRPRPKWNLDSYSEALANLAHQAYEKIEYQPAVPVDIREQRLKFRRRTPDAARLAWAKPIFTAMGDRQPKNQAEVYAREAMLLDAEPEVEIKLQAIRIGELGIATLPHEVYALTGLKLKNQSPLKTTFNIELANGAQGYIPTPEQHVLGGYTTWPARTAGLEVEAEPRQVETLLQMFEQMTGRPRRASGDPDGRYAQAVRDSKPLAYWRLDEMAGTQARDSSSHQVAAHYEPGVAFYLEGPSGAGFDGAPRNNRAIHTAGGRVKSSVQLPLDNYSVELWFWNGLPSDARPVTGYLWSRGAAGGVEESLGLGGAGESAGRLIFTGADKSSVLQGKSLIPHKTWNHVVLVRDGRAVRAYLNGAPQPDLVGEIAEPRRSEQIYFGGRSDGAFNWEGKLDELALYADALPAERIQAHFAASGSTAPPKPAAPQPLAIASAPSAKASEATSYREAVLAAKPLAYWPLHAAANHKSPDASGNQHDATLESGAAAYAPGGEQPNFTGGRAVAKLDPLGDDYSVEVLFYNEIENHARPMTGYFFSRSELGAAGSSGDNLAIGGKSTASGRLVFFNGNALNTVLAGETIIPPRTWNHVVMVRTGRKIELYLNGNSTPEISGEAERGYPAGGQLAIGGRGDNFANFNGRIQEVAVYNRPLKAEEAVAHFKASGVTIKAPDAPAPRVLADEPLPTGGQWKPLFNGKDLSGLYVIFAGQKRDVDPNKFFQVHDGNIHTYKDTPAGQRVPYGVLVTEQEYSHYRLRFQYKWGEKKFAPRMQVVRDAGLLYHMVGPDVVWPTSVECQVQEGDTGDLFTVYTRVDAPVDPNQATHFLPEQLGGVLRTTGKPRGVTRVIKRGAYEIAHDWNTVEVVVRGGDAIHLLNGKVNNRCSNMHAIDPVTGKWAPLTRGKIAFQAEASEVMYRNIEIMELEPAAEPATESPPLPPEKALQSLRVPDDFQVELVAAEPLVKDPVAIAWGADLKLWVVEMADYPLGMDNQGQPGGRIRFLEDVDGDGKYDKSTLFIDGVRMPNGILPWRNGVLVTAAPEIFYAEDTDGDGRADLRKTLYRGFKPGNPQLRINGLRWGIDNWVYCANGWSGGEIESVATGARAGLGGRDVRIRPDAHTFDLQSGVSQFGRNPDDWGHWFGVNNSYPLWHYVLADHYIRRNPHVAAPNPIRQLRLPANPEVFAISPPQKRFHSFNQSGRFTSACQSIIYRDELLFPRTAERQAFTCEPFHNLVQRAVVAEDGVSFTAQRAESAGQPEFFASSDVWCRPVMARTGPDGGLYVVDMYRFLVEHPDFLPPEGRKELAPFWRLGENQGRIYRITRKAAKPRSVAPLHKLNIPQLVAALDSPNGWQRDTAQQLLVWRADASAAAPLAALYRASQNPLARLHALGTLEGIDQLDAELLVAACEDAHPEVRRQAVRLSESRADASPSLLAALSRLAADPDAKVRLQLACSLGELNDPLAGAALAELLAQHPQDAYITAAVFSSITKENVAAVLEKFEARRANAPAHADEYSKLLGLAVALGREDAVLAAVTSQAGAPTAEQFGQAAEMLTALAGRGDPWKQLSAGGDRGGALANLKRLLTAARKLAADDQQPTALRIAALRCLAFEPDHFDADLELLAALLVPQSPPEMQAACVAQLVRHSDVRAADALLAGWKSHGPAVRGAVLTGLLSRPAWAALLVSRLEDGSVAPADLDAMSRERLASQKDAALAKRAGKLLSGGNADRQKVVAEYQSALQLTGEPQRGDLVFKQKCAACHKVGDMGHDVGPNLASLTDKSPPSLLIAIFDPNRNVETRFNNYLALTTEGRMFSGVLATETSTSITLIMQEAQQLTILRSELETLQSTGKSPMPEGFEKDLTPQAAADLIAYLRTLK